MVAKKLKTYTVSDGELVLTLEKDEGDWYCVTSPMEPELVTQAKSVPEAFEMARDAIHELHEARKDFMVQIRASMQGS